MNTYVSKRTEHLSRSMMVNLLKRVSTKEVERRHLTNELLHIHTHTSTNTRNLHKILQARRIGGKTSLRASSRTRGW